MAHHSHVVCIPASLFDSQGKRDAAINRVYLFAGDLLIVREYGAVVAKSREDPLQWGAC